MRLTSAEKMQDEGAAPRPRSVEERRNAALALAGVALSDPDLADERSQIDDLSLVLEVLGYRTKYPFGSADFRIDAYGRVDRHHRATRSKKKSSDEDTLDAEVVSAASRSRRCAVELACGRDVGTARGYNRHISTYSTPCPPCSAARTRELNERWARLGIPDHAREGVERW